MKTLIVYAHPAVEGHNSHILKEVKKQIKGKYELIDLYKLKYDSVLHEKELYTAGNKFISAQNKRFQKKISESDKIVFIYPVWWGMMPAILKGWIDRVFTAPFAFEYVKKPILGYVPQGNLKDKRAAVIVTTGAKKWQSWLILRNRFKNVMANDTLGFCGTKAKVFQLGGCGRYKPEKQKQISKIVSKALKWL